MKRALCIWLPEWPIQRLVAARPELKARPLALYARDPRRGQLVVACCPYAQRQGIAHGMPLAEASTLTKHAHRSTTNPASPRSQATHFEEHEPDLDQEGLTELAVWCEQFSPIVGLEQTDDPSSLLLDVTGLAPIFGGEPRIVELIRTAFHQRSYQVRIGVGDTVGAAWAMAHYRETRSQDLLELPAEALRLEISMLDILHQLGIVTISQLMQLPRKALATRLGEEPIRRLDQLFGKQPEVIVAHHALPAFEVEWRLEHPTSRRDIIETILEQLCEQLAAQLAKHDHAVVQAEAVLRGSQKSRQLTISLFEPTSNPRHLFDLLKLQSERTLLNEPLHCLQLHATATVRLHGGQQLLWDDMDAYTGRAQQRAVGALVDRLVSRLGKESVFGICAQAGALPEKSYRRKSLANTLRQRKSKTPPTLKAPHRPLWLYDPPLPLRIPPADRCDSLHQPANASYFGNKAREPNTLASGVVRESVASRDNMAPLGPKLAPAAHKAGAMYQPPSSFQFEHQTHQVVRHWGPERIETGWWRGRTVRRDYYRVETSEGCRFWLFRRIEDGAWFLHGSFE